MTLGDLQTYLDHLALERRLSPRTVDAYGRDLKQFLKWLTEVRRRGTGEPRPSALDYPVLARYMRSLDFAGLKANSVARHQSSLRGFFDYLVASGRMDKSPAAELGRPKVKRKLPRAISVGEVERLLSAPDPSQPLGQRDQALLETLYATGMRVSEVTGLDLGRLHLDQGYVVPFGKGGKERAVPIGAPARKALRRYLDVSRPLLLRRRRQASRGEPPVFLNFRGGGLTRAGVFAILNRHARAAGLLGPRRAIGPHLLRHAFATHLLQGGADLRVVQELLGHASITTTQIYTRVELGALREVHARFHPRG
jgi:integrase/recombinase XerD